MQPLEDYDVDYGRNPLLQPGWGKEEECVSTLNQINTAQKDQG